MAIWQGATYRTDGVDPRTIQAMNDMGWIMFMLISSAAFQFGSLGLAILADRRPQPVYPRWAGWFKFWVATLTMPAGLVVFFKEPPFAWNGADRLLPPTRVLRRLGRRYDGRALRAADAEQTARKRTRS